MLSYFVCHSLPVNHLNSSCQNFAENFLRFDCYLQGTDHSSLVVVHCRFILGCIYHCKPYSVNKKKPFTFMRYVQPFSSILNGRLGSGVGTVQLMKMVAGVINPGRPVANLYVSSNLIPD
jgi:hypothetical protein